MSKQLTSESEVVTLEPVFKAIKRIRFTSKGKAII